MNLKQLILISMLVPLFTGLCHAQAIGYGAKPPPLVDQSRLEADTALREAAGMWLRTRGPRDLGSGPVFILVEDDRLLVEWMRAHPHASWADALIPLMGTSVVWANIGDGVRLKSEAAPIFTQIAEGVPLAVVDAALKALVESDAEPLANEAVLRTFIFKTMSPAGALARAQHLRLEQPPRFDAWLSDAAEQAADDEGANKSRTSSEATVPR